MTHSKKDLAKQDAKMARLLQRRKAAYIAEQKAVMAKMLADKNYIAAARTWAGNPEEFSNSEKPDDTITLLVAIKEYNVSRATLKRAIKERKLQSYRRRNVPKNSPHIISRKEIERYYNKR